MKDKGLKLAKERSRIYPSKIITDADYTDNIALRANTPTQAETLQHRPERAAAGIVLYVYIYPTEIVQFDHLTEC